MTATKADLQHIGRWLQRVRRATAAGNEEVTADQLADYTGWLVQDFPLSCFTDASAKAVADGGEFFPKWVVLRAALVQWHDRHPDVPRLSVAIPDALQRRIEELTDSTAYFRHQDEVRMQVRDDWSDPAKIRSSLRKIGDDHPMRERMGRLLASLVKKHAPENLGYLPAEWQP